MPAERADPPSHRTRRQCAGLVFATTLVFGGGGGGWLMESLVAEAARASRQDMQILGETVARTVAAQFDRALPYGIPLEALRGTDAYLLRVLADTPGLTHIELSGVQGRVIHRVGLPPTPNEILADLPIVFQGQTLGQVRVGVAPRTLAASLAVWRWLFFAAVLCLAAAAAAWAAVGPGADLERRRRRLIDGLRSPLSWATEPDRPLAQGNQPNPETQKKTGRDPVDAALQALAEGDAQVQAKRVAFEALAQELLAVDFEGRHAPEIERLRERMRRSLDQGAP